jgi:hypothetical protein
MKKTSKPDSLRATRSGRNRATSKEPTRTAKGERKKQSISGQRQPREKEPVGAESGRGASEYSPPADFPSNKWQSEISEEEMNRALREETERNRESSNASFYFGANAKLGELFRRAKKGDVDAARMLLGCLTYNVGEFERFCSSEITMAERIVVVGESWPLLHTALEPNKDGALTIPPHHVLRKLGVVRGKRRYNTKTSVGTRVAATLYNQMEFYRHMQRQQLWDKLSENVETGAVTGSGMSEKHLGKVIDRIRQLELLSPSNYFAWWAAAEALFIWQWGKEFQDDPCFENWNAAAYRQLHGARNLKRRDIKKAIKQGFKSLANSLQDRVLD